MPPRSGLHAACLFVVSTAVLTGCSGADSEAAAPIGIPTAAPTGVPPASSADAGAPIGPVPTDAGAPNDQDASTPLDAGTSNDAGPPDFADAGGNPSLDGGVPPALTLEDLLVSSWSSPGDDAYAGLPRLNSVELEMVRSPCGAPVTHGRTIEFVPEADATLELRIAGDGTQTTLLQGRCGVLNSTKNCVAESQQSVLRGALTAGEPACLVLGFDGLATAQAQLGAVTCGDQIVNQSEDCDFGDQIPGDGCDENCQFEVPGMADQCPGQSETLEDVLLLSGHTVGYTDRAPASCGALPGGPDRVFSILPVSSGTLNARLTADFDAVLSVFRSCSEARELSDLLACSDAPLSAAPEEVTFPVEGVELYWISVDGYGVSHHGNFELELQLVSGP